MVLKMYFVVAILIILCNISSLVKSDPVFGKNVILANRKEFSVVSLKRKTQPKKEVEKDHLCTGTLITKKDVLTSAHCENYFKGYVCEIKVGSVDIREGHTFYALWWMSYSKWTTKKNIKRRYQEKDIAIIRLNERVPDYIQIPKRAILQSNYLGKNVSVATFGSTGTDKHSRFIQTIDLKIVSNQKCEDGGKTKKLLEIFLCASAEPYVIMTTGNDGAPLFYENKLIGIYKGHWPKQARHSVAQKANLFLSIYYYQDYIEDVIYNF